MKTAGMLAPSTDVNGLAAKAFVHLDGVSDEWLNSLPVEKVAGGQVPRSWVLREYAKAELFCGLCLPYPVQ
jgi:NitT/TauT family transport system substrate-binding protein